MQIQVRINEEGALRNQRHAFSNRFTLLSELLQNARRAGATRIEIHHDAGAQLLRVHDNGCGLEDFQKLLSFHETGWDAATRTEERPFGVGFSKCLYAATRCIVASGRRLVGLAEGLALGLTELSRLPAFALEGGQFRHGPMEMLAPGVGAVFFRGADATGEAVRRLAAAVAEAGSPAVVLDASGGVPAAGAETVSVGRHEGLAALAALVPVSQRLMLDFAATKVAEVGRPLRSTKITRIE